MGRLVELSAVQLELSNSSKPPSSHTPEHGGVIVPHLCMVAQSGGRKGWSRDGARGGRGGGVRLRDSHAMHVDELKQLAVDATNRH